MIKEEIELTVYEAYYQWQLQSLFKLEYLKELVEQNRDEFESLMSKEHKGQRLLEIDGEELRPEIEFPTQKGELVKLLTTIFSAKELFLKLVECLPPNVCKVFEMLTWKNHIKADYLEKEFKEIIVLDRKNEHYGEARSFNPDYFFFCFSVKFSFRNSENMYEYFLFLPDKVRSQLKEYFPNPEGYELEALDTITDTDYLFEDKGELINELPLYINYVQQGHFKFGKNNLPLRTSLRKMKTSCDIDEFYENGKDDFELMRTRFISNLILSKRRLKDLEMEMSNPLEVFKQLFKQFELNKLSVMKNFIFHLKGIKQCFRHEELTSVTAELLGLLRALPVNKWISLKNIVNYVQLREINMKIVSNYAAERYLYIVKKLPCESFYDSDKEYITPDRYSEAITSPLVGASMFFFASLGLVDIAYNDLQKSKEYLSIFEGLEFVRLTDLGAYITEQKNDYVIEKSSDNLVEAVLDEQRLIVTLTGNDKLKSLLLTSMADTIGENRYMLSHSSFFKECSSKGDVEKKVTIFKNEISSNLPQIWVEFFNDLMSRYNPLELQDSMCVYKIADNKELINLIAKDEVLKRYILKVENYHIALRKNDFSYVKKRLETLGYLIGKR